MVMKRKNKTCSGSCVCGGGPRVRRCGLVLIPLLIGLLSLSVVVVFRRRNVTVRRSAQSKAEETISILSLGLMDTRTNSKVVDLYDGIVIDLAAYGIVTAPSFSIDAIVSDSNNAGSVLFSYGDILQYSVENFAPMAMCGNFGWEYMECPELGQLGTPHTVTVTPYTEKLLQGQAGRPVTVTFTVVADSSSSSNRDADGSAASRNETAVLPCEIPKWEGEWEWGVFQYPISVAEAQGGRVGDDELVVIGGFKDGYRSTTTESFILNVTNSTVAEWEQLDDMPVPVGITHSAFAMIDSDVMILCGGYVGGNIGPETDVCLALDSTKPSGEQWTFFDSLPEGRAGGGMIYNSWYRQLVFSGGAQRPQPGQSIAHDFNDTWIYDFNDPSASWTEAPALPFLGNHMSFVTGRDQYDHERHFLLGGQKGEDEEGGNTKEVYEWDASIQTWISHTDMPFTRGHSASATKAISCGFIVAGGTTNENGMTSDISYYDIPSLNWTKLGDLPSAVNTAVCDFVGGYLYCETGWAQGRYSARRKITLGR